MRNLIRRWLGVPTRAEIREMILREIDADAVWRTSPRIGESKIATRVQREQDRAFAQEIGAREDTRA